MLLLAFPPPTAFTGEERSIVGKADLISSGKNRIQTGFSGGRLGMAATGEMKEDANTGRREKWETV